MIYYYKRLNKTQNNIVTLKNSNIALQNNIIKHLKKCYTQNNIITTYETKLQHKQ